MTKLFRAHRSSEVPAQHGILSNPYLNMARKPRDTSRELHEIADAWFEHQFGIRFRSRTLFCNGNRADAEEYCDSNHVLISIEPIGDYVFCYSPNCRDMYYHFKSVGNHPWEKDKVWKELDSLKYLIGKNTSWHSAANSGSEIMLFANEFDYRYEY